MKSLRQKMVAMAAVVAISGLMMASVAGAATPKLLVKDSTATTKFVVNDDGTMGAGVSSTIYPFEMTSDNAGAVPAGVGAFIMNGSTNKERFEVRSAGAVYAQGPTFQGKGAGWDAVNKVATKTLFDHVLFALGGSGHDGTQWVLPNRALVKIKASADWSTTSQPTTISFEAVPAGQTARVEYLSINKSGFSEVQVSNAPLKINTPGTAPTCDSTRRGSLWINQGASVDTVQACVQTATGVYGWKTLTLQ